MGVRVSLALVVRASAGICMWQSVHSLSHLMDACTLPCSLPGTFLSFSLAASLCLVGVGAQLVVLFLKNIVHMHDAVAQSHVCFQHALPFTSSISACVCCAHGRAGSKEHWGSTMKPLPHPKQALCLEWTLQ